MSLNPWLYVGSSPVNRVDPTGHMCSGEGCSADYAPGYDILLASSSLRAALTESCGSPNPVLFLRPPSRGYAEGSSFSVEAGYGAIGGNEVVYDYATMSRGLFEYSGHLIGVAGGFSLTTYASALWGFNWDSAERTYEKTFRDDYWGKVRGVYLGAIIGPITQGIGYSQSVRGNVKGVFSYLAFGQSLPWPAEAVYFESDYRDKSFLERYVDAEHNVDEPQLIRDILEGSRSPAGFLPRLGGVGAVFWARDRTAQIFVVLDQASRYELLAGYTPPPLRRRQVGW